MSDNLKPLHICFIAGTLGQGGAERQLYYILSALRGIGYQLSLITLTQNEFWEKPISDLGVKIHHTAKGSGSISKLRQIVGLVADIKPDIIQSQHFYTNLYAALSGKWINKPAFGALRCGLYDEIAETGRILGPLSFRIPRYIISNSLEAIERSLSSGKRKDRVFYLPNVVDTLKFQPLEEKPSADRIRIISIGRLFPQKRFDRLIEYVSEAAKGHVQGIELTIVGNGPLKNDLLELARIHAADNFTIKFMDAHPSPELLYQSADIYVLTSDFEGTPNVVLEAMSSGLPILATAVGNLPNIITNGNNGYIFPLEDKSGFIAQLFHLLESKNLRDEIGHNARKYILDHNSGNTVERKLPEIYKQVLAQK